MIHFTSPAGVCTPGSAPCPTLGNECGKTLPFYLLICLFSCYIGLYCTISSYTGFAVPTMTSCLYSYHVVLCACGLLCHRLRALWSYGSHSFFTKPSCKPCTLLSTVHTMTQYYFVINSLQMFHFLITYNDEYCHLQRDIAYSLSGIFCDALL